MGFMKLCLAEKPSVAKEIARVIGANSRKDGYFEGNGYQVSWTFGHLCTLKTPDDYTPEWKWWKLHSLPMIPQRFGIKLIDNDGIVKQFNTIKSLCESCDEVINCGDAGIEGELIQRWVLLKAQSKAPLKRLWISSLTEEAIKEGFEKLQDGNEFDKLYAAGNARAIGDWLLGMNATRLYTVKFAKGKGVLSIGRVQTPTLALIVNRYKEIINFTPYPFWELKTTYRNVVFNSTKGRFHDKNEAEKAAAAIKEHELEIQSSTKKKGKESPPKLFDLTSLQVECNRKYDFTADETLKYIQTLYERKLVTYPRVDTTFLPTDMYPKVEKTLRGLKPYDRFTEKILSGKIPKSKKVFDDKKITDHHAIIPTGINPENLNLEQKKVYDTITRRFIAVFYPDCIVSNTTVISTSAGQEFKATGRVIVDPGWRVLYPQKSVGKIKDEPQEMPVFEKGEKGPHEPDLQEKETTPPKHYTEATLLRAMETAGKNVEDEELRDVMKENGIGRPSTRANIIETLFKRKYIIRERKNLIPTTTGIELINTISNDLLKSVELTGIWERKLRQIEKGEYEASSFMEEMKAMVSELVLEVKRENNASITIQEEEEKPKPKQRSNKTSIDSLECPKCKKHNLLKGKTAFGCGGYKEGCEFKVSFENFGKKLTEKQLVTLIKKGKTNLLKGFLIDEQKVNGRLIITPEFSIEIEENQEHKKNTTVELKCPACKQGLMLKGKSAFGCSRYKHGCKFIVPFDEIESKFNTKILTPEILKTVHQNRVM
jgi:DNA topoisomerase-3